MRIHTKTVWQMGDDPDVYAILQDESSEYSGPIAKADRSIQGADQQNAKQAGGVASGYGQTAGNIQGSILPTLTQEATHPTGYDPTTMNNMLVAGEQGAGGSNSAITGQAGLAAGRTRNSGALSSVLDQAARRTGQTNSENALNVQNSSAKLAQQKQQQALGQLQGLYGTDVSAQLKGMGLQSQDEQDALQAGNSGWLQQGLSAVNTLGGAAKGPMAYL
jgi:hypothetical protein